jgi:hypothetical protein
MLFANSKTQVLQDLSGIIAAIGLAFAVLSLTTGDTVGYDPTGPHAQNPNLLQYFTSYFKVRVFTGRPWIAFCDFCLVVMVAYRFYYVNTRYLANRYGVEGLCKRDWRQYTLLDAPAILVEGLLFAAAGLMVNHPFAVFVCLGLGFTADTMWNLIYLAFAAYFAKSCGSMRIKAWYQENVPGHADSWFSWCSIANNGAMAVAVMALGLYFRWSSPTIPHILTRWEFWALLAGMVANHCISVFYYTWHYFTHPAS